MEPICLSADEWINKCNIAMQWNIIHPWKGNTDTHYHIDEPGTHFAK